MIPLVVQLGNGRFDVVTPGDRGLPRLHRPEGPYRFDALCLCLRLAPLLGFAGCTCRRRLEGTAA